MQRRKHELDEVSHAHFVLRIVQARYVFFTETQLYDQKIKMIF